jgi:hypothetical protein
MVRKKLTFSIIITIKHLNGIGKINKFWLSLIKWLINREKMPFCGETQTTIEKTPSYFRTPEVPKRVFKMNPETKLILIIRDPVIRLISTYVHLIALNRLIFDPVKYSSESKHLEDLIFYKNGSIRPDSEQGKKYPIKFFEDSLYVKHLQKWLKYFPLNQILILDGEKYIVDPYSQLKKVEEFLRLKSFFTPDNFIFNKEKGFFCVNKRFSSKKGCLEERKGRLHPVIDLNITIKLRNYFRTYDVELFDLIKMNPFWKI